MTPMALAAATATLKAAIGPELDDARVQALGAAAAALVENYAPAAPEALRCEATIRTAGYLCEQPSGAVRSNREGEIGTDYAPTHLSALRHSGAMALLSSFKPRAGGLTG